MCKHQDRKKSYGEGVVKLNNHVAPGTLETGKPKASHYQSSKALCIALTKPQSSSEMELAGGGGWYDTPAHHRRAACSPVSQVNALGPLPPTAMDQSFSKLPFATPQREAQVGLPLLLDGAG